MEVPNLVLGLRPNTSRGYPLLSNPIPYQTPHSPLQGQRATNTGPVGPTLVSYPLRHLGLGERDRGEAPHPPEGACDRKGDAASPGSQGQGVTTPSHDLRRITTPPQAEQEDEHGLWAALPLRRVITLALPNPTERLVGVRPKSRATLRAGIPSALVPPRDRENAAYAAQSASASTRKFPCLRSAARASGAR